MKTALCIVAMICLGCVSYAAIEFGILSNRQQAVDLQASLTHLNKTLDNADSAIGVFHDAEQKQANFYDPQKAGGATQQIQRILVDLKHLIGTTDSNLNGTPDGRGAAAIPALAQTIRQGGNLFMSTGTDLDDVAQSVNRSVTSLQPGIANMVRASQAAADTLADPSIKQTLEHVDATGANVEMTTHDISVYVHRETAPVRGTWNLIKSFLVTFAGPAAQVATAAK